MSLHIDKHQQGLLWDERVLIPGDREEPSNLTRARAQIKLAIDLEGGGEDATRKLAAATTATAMALIELERIEYSQRQSAEKPEPTKPTRIRHFGSADEPYDAAAFQEIP